MATEPCDCPACGKKAEWPKCEHCGVKIPSRYEIVYDIARSALRALPKIGETFEVALQTGNAGLARTGFADLAKIAEALGTICAINVSMEKELQNEA